MNQGEREISLMSFNVTGLNNPIKRFRLRRLIKNSNCDIICCQETHICKQDEKYLRETFAVTILHAAAEMKKRGVMIGLSKRLNWQMHEIVADPEGQSLLIHGEIREAQWTIVGIYAPQTKKNCFF